MSWTPPPPGPPNPPDPPGPPPFEPSGYPPPWPAPPPPPNNARRNVLLTIITIAIIAAGSIVGWRLASNNTSSGTAAPLPGGHHVRQHTLVPSTSPQPHSTPPSSGSPSTGPSSAPAPASCDASPGQQNDVLAAQLSAVIQHHDRAGFLALATDAATRSKMAMWWDNVNALGFTFGGATAGAVANGGNRRVSMGIGLHNPLDGTTTNIGGTSVPDSPTTWYQLTTAPGHGCLQRISGWQSLSDAPWDEPYRLKVVKTTHAEVAGPSSVAHSIRRVARLAEKAALWDLSFFKKNNGQRYLDHVRQKGFVVFVPGTNTTAAKWFRGDHARSPRRWTADPARFAGLTFPLASPQYPMHSALPHTPGAALKYKDDYVPAGGARVIIDGTATNQTDRGLEGTLVHEFVHDLLTTYNTGFYFGGKGVDAAVTEGAARLLETYFYDSPDCYCKHHGQLPRAFPMLKVELRKHFGLFHGRYPTDAQIYGGDGKLANYYYDVAASTFDYEIYSGGVPFGLQSIVDAYINGGGPFDGVFLRYRGHTEIFANPKTEEGKWAKWLRKQMR